MIARGNPPLTLLRLSPDDWPLWRKLRLCALEEAPDAFSAKLEDWQGEADTEWRWRSRLAAVPLNVVGCFDRTEAGMVSATAPRDGATALISTWVAPFARGRGIGDALVKEVVTWAGEQGARRIDLAVFETNVRAIALYHRHGFLDCGRMDAESTDSQLARKMVREMAD